MALAVPCLGLSAPDGGGCSVSCSSLLLTKQIEIWCCFPSPSLWWSEARALFLDCFSGEGTGGFKGFVTCKKWVLWGIYLSCRIFRKVPRAQQSSALLPLALRCRCCGEGSCSSVVTQQRGGSLYAAARQPPKGFPACKVPCGVAELRTLLSSSAAAQCNSREMFSLWKPGFESMQELRCISLMLAGLALESY